MRKKRRFAHIIVLSAALILAAAFCVIFFSGSGDADVPAYGNGQVSPFRINPGSVLAHRFRTESDMTGISVRTPTWVTNDGVMTLSLYRWTGDYTSTVNSPPLSETTFYGVSDQADSKLDFASSLPPGEYLFAVKTVSGIIGVYKQDGNSVTHGCTYCNGVQEITEFGITVSFASATGKYFGEIDFDMEVKAHQAFGQGSASDFPINEKTGSAGQRLKTSTRIHGFSIDFLQLTGPSSAQISVYGWKGSYANTIGSAPVFTMKTYGGGTKTVTFDSPLPAGEYLFLIYDTTGTLDLTRYGTNGVSGGYSYSDGVEFMMDLGLTVICDTPENGEVFVPCRGADDEATGNANPPKEYVIPKDSLIYTHEVMPDTWVFTDGLGREALTNSDVGDPRDGKTLAMFYWDWHASSGAILDPLNVQDYVDKHPEIKNDYSSPLWPTSWTTYFWDEPIFGYYRLSDQWVVRKHAELLANAGVDVIFTDNTNGVMIYKEGYDALFKGFTDAQNSGINAPKISFMLPFAANDDTTSQLKSLYLDIYKNGKYRNLWYYLDGKPMLMAYSSQLDSGDNLEKEIGSFFTFRSGYPEYKDRRAANRKYYWGWLSMYPQAFYSLNGKPEQITVGVAQNHNYVTGKLAAMNGENIAGRSYTSTYPNRFDVEGKSASLWGYNFSEQFDYALSVDPSTVFVTGWNEWNAGRYPDWLGTSNAFPDTFNDEFSRDIEPTRGALRDNYYYLLVNYVRRYKGARPIPAPSAKKYIDITAGQSQWSDVEPYYAAYMNSTGDRDARGCGSSYYTDFSGRNDIIGAQVARDQEYIYFNVECAENITPYTDNLWMNLYIDCGASGTGWESFDYVVNKTKPGKSKAVLERFTGNGFSSKKVSDVSYSVDGRFMTVRIPKKDLGISGDDFTINFLWTDNVHDFDDTGRKPTSRDKTKCEMIYTRFSGDILDFYTSGDVAPGGRFKFSYVSTSENAGPDVAIPDQSSVTSDDAGETTAEDTVTQTETETETDTGITTSADTEMETGEETSASDIAGTSEKESEESTVPVSGGTDHSTEPDADSGHSSGEAGAATEKPGNKGAGKIRNGLLIGMAAGAAAASAVIFAVLKRRKDKKA